MSATVFATPQNNVSTLVGPSGYTSGSGSLVLVSGGGALFPALSGSNFYRITVIQAASAYLPTATGSNFTIFKVTAVSGDTLTIASVMEGTTDRNYAANDVVEIRACAGSLSDIHTAVNTLETTAATVTSASVVTANGFAGSVATATTTPAITLTTSITGLLKGNGTAISAAAAGSDYLAPAGSGAALTGITESQVTGLVSDLAGKSMALTRTAVKTSAYTAAAGDLVPVDTTSGSVTITLPAAPADRSRIAVKHILQGGTNTVSVACGGSDTFNRTGGATTTTLSLLAEAIVLEYNAAGSIWTIVADDTPLSQLDLRYSNLASPAFTGTPTAPTATTGTNTTQIATTAFVLANIPVQVNPTYYSLYGGV